MTQSVSKASELLEQHASHEVTLAYLPTDHFDGTKATWIDESRHQSLEEAIHKMIRDHNDPAFCQVLIHQIDNPIQLNPTDVAMIMGHLKDRALDTK